MDGPRTLPIYESPWVSLDLVDVELPDGQRFEQHVVRMARPVAGAAVIREPGQVLLIWRHRHVTGTWGWEIPMGRVEEGESPEQAAAREVEEETGWRPGPAAPACRLPAVQRIGGLGALPVPRPRRPVRLPSDRTEADRIEWVPLADVPGLIDRGAIVSGATLIALSTCSRRGSHPARYLAETR